MKFDLYMLFKHIRTQLVWDELGVSLEISYQAEEK